MPEIAQYLKTSVEITDASLPIFNPNDGWIDNGTQFLFDFRRTTCWPSQADPAVGTTPILNLVTGAPNASIVVPVSGATFRENGIYFNGANNVMNVGSATDFELDTLGNPDVLYIIWIKRETGFSSAGYQNFMGRGANTVAANMEFQMGGAASGLGLNESFSNGAVSASCAGGVAGTLFNSLLDTTVQVCLAFESGYCKSFINGVAQLTPSVMSKPFNNINRAIEVGYGVGGPSLKAIIKRLGMTKLGYGKTAAERVLDDWNSNHVALNVV